MHPSAAPALSALPLAALPEPVPASSPPASSPSSSPPASSPGARRGASRANPGARARAQLAPPPPNSCVVLKNLDYKITQDELVEIVRNVAGGRKEFDSVSLIADKATGNFRGMAFVNFHTVDDAAAALAALSKMVINGRRVVAEYRRLRPGEREKREAAAERRRINVHAPRATFEQSVQDVDAEGNAMDKRRAFFHTREVVRKADEKSRAAEKADRDREREVSFRTRLVEYRDAAPPADKEAIEDITFENDLTSYERRMVHVICDEIGLGHMSVLGPDGVRVLKVTKHPGRMAEWADLTADIRAAANERKGGTDAEEKKRRKEVRREATRVASSPNGHGTSDWKKGAADNSTQGGPVTKEELEGIKWFKPRSAKAADGEELNASNAIKLPQYKLYIPPRQPSGPDGTIGFHKRKPPATKDRSTDNEDSSSGDTETQSNGDAENGASPQQSSPSATESTDAQQPAVSVPSTGDRIKSPGSSQTHLNPSVPAFTPSAAYAS